MAGAVLLLALLVATTLAALSALHVFWACGGRLGWLAALPEVDGKPLFRPSTLATLGVAVLLVLAAALVAVTGGLWPAPAAVPGGVLRGLTFALAAVLALRAVGDFRLVGFFKRVRGTRFARLDSLVYSPLCALLAVATFVVAWGAGG
jgi:hypothetical protein